MSNDISIFVKTWVSTKLKFMVKWNNQKCFKSASGSVAFKKNTWGIPWNIPPGTPNCIKLNWQHQCYSLHPAIEILCNSNHPMWTLHNLSIMGQWHQWVNMNRGSASNYIDSMITKDLNRWPRPFRTQLCMNHICRHNRNRDWAITYIQLYWTKFRIPVVYIIGRTFMGMFWLFQQLPCPKCNNFHKNAIFWKAH